MGVMKRIGSLAVALSITNWVAAPLAQGAVTTRDRQNLNSMLRHVGLAGNKTTTIGEFYAQFRHFYPPELRLELDSWATLHKDEPMPKVDVQVIKDNFGEERFKLNFRRDGKSASVTFGSDNIKLNSTTYTVADARNPQAFFQKLLKEDAGLRKVFEKDTGMWIGYGRLEATDKEVLRMTPLQYGHYRVKYRETVDAAVEVLRVAGKLEVSSRQETEKFEVISRWLMGEPAFAKAVAGGKCIVAGYVTTYGPNLSCGSDGKGGLHEGFDRIVDKRAPPHVKACGPSQIPCNPLVYGFNQNGGVSMYCIPTGQPLQVATKTCDKQSPLHGIEDKKRIANSWVKALGKDEKDLKFKDDKIDPEDYERIKKFFVGNEHRKGLHGLVDEAREYCKDPKGQGVDNKRKDQQLACEGLWARAFDLEKFIVAPTEEPCDKPGYSRNSEGKCVCTPPCEEGRRPSAEPAPAPRETHEKECRVVQPPERAERVYETDERPLPPREKEKKSGFGFSFNKDWLIGGLLIGGLALGAWWLFKDDKKKKPPTYVPPVCTHPLCGGPGPTPTPTPTTPPIVPNAETGGGAVAPPINSGGVGR